MFIQIDNINIKVFSKIGYLFQSTIQFSRNKVFQPLNKTMKIHENIERS